MYNLYDKYLRGNSIGSCPLYVSYYLHSLHIKKTNVLTWELNRYGRRRRRTTDDGRRHTLNLFRVLEVVSSLITNWYCTTLSSLLG